MVFTFGFDVPFIELILVMLLVNIFTLIIIIFLFRKTMLMEGKLGNIADKLLTLEDKELEELREIGRIKGRKIGKPIITKTKIVNNKPTKVQEDDNNNKKKVKFI